MTYQEGEEAEGEKSLESRGNYTSLLQELVFQPKSSFQM